MANFHDLKRKGFEGGRPTLKQIDRLSDEEYSALVRKYPVRRRYASGCRETYQEAEQEINEARNYRGAFCKTIRDCE